MTYPRTSFGIANNNCFVIFFALCFVITSCDTKQKERPEVIGNEVFKENINVLLDSLFIFDDSLKMNVEIEKKIEKGGIPDHNDIFGITARIQKRIPNLNPENFYDFNLSENHSIMIEERRIEIVELHKSKLYPRTIAIQMSNFYLDSNKNEAFIIVNKGIKRSVGQKTDIYYFNKIKGKWIFQNKDVLLKG